MVLATGDFFGPSSDDFNEDELKELLENKLEGCYTIILKYILAKTTTVPIQVYIMQGEHPLPQAVIDKVKESGGQLCNNIFLLSALYIDFD